jgi:hypothetical protein
MAKKTQTKDMPQDERLIQIGKKLLESYPAQSHLWINGKRQVLFSEDGREGFIRITRDEIPVEVEKQIEN